MISAGQIVGRKTCCFRYIKFKGVIFMQPYTGFASVYDIFMDNVPYDEWADYVQQLLKKNKIDKGLLLELGCGTGSMTRRLASKGFDMIGIDNSEEMLSIAREKSNQEVKSNQEIKSNQEVKSNQEIKSNQEVNSNQEVKSNQEVSSNQEVKSNQEVNSTKKENSAQEELSPQDDVDDILYLCQDMREFELYGTVAAVISVCDSMNYILSEEDLLQVFRLVNKYLDPNGLFIFDLDTQYDYEEILGDSTIAENREEGSFIWENTYYEDEMLNEINLTLFIPEEDKSIYRKYEETHYRRAYPIDTITRLVEEAGMELVAIYDALTEKKPKKDCERVYIIAREKRQADKLYI
jgi:SAM-dependent methyltransferase